MYRCHLLRRNTRVLSTLGVFVYAALFVCSGPVRADLVGNNSVNGRAFEDAADTGSYDPSTDPPLAGVTVNVYVDFDGDGIFEPGDDDGLPIGVAVTDANGFYEFSGLFDGPYWLEVITPAGYLATSPRSLLVELTGGDLTGQDFGQTILGSIHGFTFEDIDGDGIYTEGTDQPLTGVEFRITGTDGEGFVVDFFVSSDPNGEFVFDNLWPSVASAGSGTGYTITETVPPGFVATTPTSYTTDLFSGQELVALAGQALVSPLQVEVLVGEDLFFGETAPGAIHGFTFEDGDADGQYEGFDPDTGDVSLAGVAFTLTGIDGQGNVVNITEITDANGEFAFTGLLPSVAGSGPGTGYTVTETLRPGFINTTPTSFTTDLESGVNWVALPGQSTLGPGQVETVSSRLIFGNTVYGSVHGIVFDDGGADGLYDPAIDTRLPGVVIHLIENAFRSVVDTTVSDASGEFHFTSVKPFFVGSGFGGSYSLEQIPPAGFVSTKGFGSAFDLFSREELVALEGQAMIPPGDPRVERVVGSSLIIGNTVPGAIYGFKFEDVDGDGVYSSGTDQPLPGVEFTLTGTDGQGNVVNRTEVTDANGEVAFTGLLPSIPGAGPGTQYTITETVPFGFVATTPTSHSDFLASREVLVAFPGQVLLPPGDPRNEVVIGPPLQFGNAASASIHGFSFGDLDGNGLYDPLIDVEASGVEFTLTGTDGQGNVIHTSVLTDFSGAFSFTGLLPSVEGSGPGTGYLVTETLPPGVGPTTPVSYNADLTSGEAQVFQAGQSGLLGPGQFENVVGSSLGFGLFLQPFFTSISITNNEMRLQLECPLDGTFSIEGSGDIVAGWEPVDTINCSGGSATIHLGPVDLLNTNRIYRAVK